MIAILLVTGLYVGALWMLVRRWNRGLGSGQFVLALLPICLLFIAAPVPFSIGALIQAFRGVADQGSGTLAAVGPFCVTIVGELRLATLACLTALSTAAAVQAFATSDGPAIGAPSGAHSGTWWRVLILGAAPVLTVPVVFLTYLARGISSLVMRAGVPSPDFAAGDAAELSATIARHVVGTIALGMFSMVLLCGAGVGTVLAARSGTTQDRLTGYSWAVIAVVFGWGVWLVVQLSEEVRTLEAALR